MAIKCIAKSSLSAEQLVKEVEKLYSTYPETNIKKLDIKPNGFLYSILAIYDDETKEGK